MATTKRSKQGRAVATRAKASARSAKSPKAAKTSTKMSTKTSTKTSTKSGTKKAPKVAARSGGNAKPVRKVVTKATSGGAKRAITKPVGESAEVVSLKAKFQRERNGLQKNLTEAVREIGILRHHELRVMQLERQLGERDATIGRLQSQLAELERRAPEPVYVTEVQQTLALGIVATHDVEAEATDLDEFEDDRLPDESDVLSDDE